MNSDLIQRWDDDDDKDACSRALPITIRLYLVHASLSLFLCFARFLFHTEVLARRASTMMDMFNEQRSSTKDDELWHAQVITIIVIISFFSFHRRQNIENRWEPLKAFWSMDKSSKKLVDNVWSFFLCTHTKKKHLIQGKKSKWY